MSNSTKSSLHQVCLDLLKTKISTLERNIKDAQKAASDDTKSSAGDKFETSREMMKQEINKHNAQLANSNKMLKYLNQIKPNVTHEQVKFGSLVETNEGHYYFSVSLGKVEMNGKTYFSLSLASPIGKALMDKKVGDEVSFMGRKILIKTIS